jgi:PAS domain S-box-containing protein
MKIKNDFDRLSIHLIFRFIVVVLLTAVLVGLPAIWLLQNQLKHQAWSQVEQGQLTTVSLYEKKYLELKNIAILTAQRPTLQVLLEGEDLTSLDEYLITLQTGANVDLINICRAQTTIAGTELTIPACSDRSIDGYYIDEKNNPGNLWMITRTPIIFSTSQGEVIIGVILDNGFAADMRDQTGLEQALFFQDQTMSSSFRSNAKLLSNLGDCINEEGNKISDLPCNLDDVPYYIASIPLDENGLNGVVALDISEISKAEQRVVLWMSAAMVGVAGAGTALGILMARRISQPLVKLSNTAASFSRGDLKTPVETESKVREITLVARALDNARIDLFATLTSLENERDWSGNLLASSGEGIVTLDTDHRITFFSHGAERLTGWVNEEVLGLPINKVFQLANSEQKFSSLLLSDPGGYQKADVLLSDKRIVSFSITSAQLTRSGEKESELALVFRDISEEEAVHRLLGYFIANFAHELRTPLTALEASIELLLDQDGDLNPDERLELYNSLHLGIIGLHTLVDNLLESANIEARRFRISPRSADIGMILAEAVQTMQPLLIKYEQRLTAELPVDLPGVEADPRRIVQVLVNLISNASRYGPPAEEIILKVTTTPPYVRLAVIDRGPGIPPEHRANIFRRFKYPHADDAISKAGAGLGLSVVKAIVLAHGGEVGVQDRPGGGSIFWFTLPIAKETP